MIRVYVDGSGHARGGPGGTGYYAELADGIYLEGNLELDNATNQQAEILAAAYALHVLERAEVTVVSDSEYLVLGWSRLPEWIGRGWRTRSGPVANRRHWERLLDAVAQHVHVRFEWTRGHEGTVGNERADKLAGAARRAALERIRSVA